MPISSSAILLSKSEVLSGSTTFEWGGILFATSELLIYVDGVLQTEGAGNDYTVSGTTTNGVYYDGVTVTFTSSITGTVVGVFDPNFTQGFDWNANEDLPPAEVEVAVDRNCVLSAIGGGWKEFAIKFPQSEADPVNEVPSIANRSGKVLAFDSLGNLTVTALQSALSNGDVVVGATSGTNTYTLTPSPAITAYSSTSLYIALITNGNTSASVTLNISGVGAVNVLDSEGNAPAIGDLPTGFVALIAYDGANFRLINKKDQDVYVPRSVSVDTTTGIISDADGNIIHNTGASAQTVKTLPASPSINDEYTAYVADDDGYRLLANTGQTIAINAGSNRKTTKSAGYIESSELGAWITLKYIASNTWVEIGGRGLWTVETS